MKKKALIAALAAGAAGAAAGGTPVYAAEEPVAEEVQEAVQEDTVYESEAAEDEGWSGTEMCEAPSADPWEAQPEPGDGGYSPAGDGEGFSEEAPAEESFAEDEGGYPCENVIAESSDENGESLEDVQKCGEELIDGGEEDSYAGEESAFYPEDEEVPEDNWEVLTDCGEDSGSEDNETFFEDDGGVQASETEDDDEVLPQDGEENSSGSEAPEDLQGADSFPANEDSGIQAPEDAEDGTQVFEGLYDEDGELSDSLIEEAGQIAESVRNAEEVPEMTAENYAGMLKTAFALRENAAAVNIEAPDRTEDEIISYYNDHLLKYHDDSRENPFSFKAQTLKEDGTLSDESKQQFLDVFNFIRWMSGVQPVTEDLQKTEYCQYGVDYLFDRNLALNHYAAANETSEEGKKAHNGLRYANLSWASWENANVFDRLIDLWQDDGRGTIVNVGHKRNMLAPGLKTIGFGYRTGVHGTYLSVHVLGFDQDYVPGIRTFTGGDVPVEYIGYESDTGGFSPWVVHFGGNVRPQSGSSDGSSLGVTVTRDDGKVYNFTRNEDANGDFSKKNPWFYYGTTPYGGTEAVMINPYQLCEGGKIEDLAGHSFTVRVTGLRDMSKRQDFECSYTVNFFSLSERMGAEREDREKAQAVSDQIQSLPSEITKADRQKVEEAAKAYSALTDSQKSHVTGAEIISKAQETLKDIDAAEKAEDAVGAIPQTLSLDDAPTVKKADEAYSALTDSQKARVSQETVNRLNAAKAEIARLKKEEADKAAAAGVESAISAVTDDNSLLSARDAYNALTPEQQAMVSPELVSTLNEKLADYEVRENQKREDAEAVKNFEDALGALPDELSLEDARTVEQARRVYDALTDAQKGMTSDADLLKAEEKITDLRKAYEQDLAKADDYSARLGGFISKEMTLEDRAELDALRKEYESLPESVKALLTEDAAGMLDRADAAVSKLEEEEYLKPVLAVEDLISKIPDTVTLNDRQSVKDARDAFDRLDADRQEKVSSAGRIEEAEKEIARLEEEQSKLEADQKAADSVSEKISALNDNISLNDEQMVAQAREAFESLTDTQKEMVDANALNKLSAAEAGIASLKQEREDKRAAESAEQAVLSISDDESLLNAKAVYESLTPAQQALVNPDLVKTLNEKLADYEIRENQKREDTEAVKNFEDALNAIPADLTLKDAGAVEQARRVYDALTDSQKAMTSDETLRKAEGEIAALKKAYEEDLKTAEDFENDLGMFEGIDLSLKDESAFNDLLSRFNVMTDSQKALLKDGTGDRLSGIAETFARLRTQEENRRAALAVSDQIKNLPENPELKDADLIEKAVQAYESLPDAAKALVPKEDAERLEGASERIAVLRTEKADREAAGKVQDLIDAIPDRPGIEDKGAVEEAKKAWDALTDAQKKLVDASGLEDALEAVKAAEISNWLEESNGVYGSKDDAELGKIRDLFDSLKDKEFISPGLQAKLADLLSQKEDYDRGKADETAMLVSLLTNRPTVGTAAAAAGSYSGLTEDQKGYVSGETLAVLRDYADADEAPQTGTAPSPLAAAAGAGLLGGAAGLAVVLRKRRRL